MTEFFDTVSEPIRYEGPDSDNPLAFGCNDADRVVLGKTMADHRRFGVCYWHSFNWDGADIFGDPADRQPPHQALGVDRKGADQMGTGTATGGPRRPYGPRKTKPAEPATQVRPFPMS